jgi:putative transposase
LIHAEKDIYDITFMCRLMKVPRSTHYAWTDQAETKTPARRRALAAEVAKEFDDSRQTSGCRWIAAALNRRGIACSVGLVADLMRELGLAAVQPRASKRTTLPGSAPVPAEDLLERNFTATAPGQRLVGDITYLRTGEGWLYPATVIDLATRVVVDWQLAAHMRTTLVTDALQMAIDGGHVTPDAIFHSDRGTQYTSAEFDAFTAKNRIRRSLGRTGVCWDNAAAESFFAALKNEMYYRQSFATRARAHSRSRNTSRSSTTASACIPRSATALPSKRSPTTAPPRPPRRDQPEDLSTILDTAQTSWWRRGGGSERTGAVPGLIG